MWLVAMLAGSAQAVEPFHLVGSVAQKAFTCQPAQDIIIEASSLTLQFNGDCGSLKIVGADNAITLDGVAAVNVQGTGNQVTWKRNLSGGKQLPVSKVGSGNKIKNED